MDDELSFVILVRPVATDPDLFCFGAGLAREQAPLTLLLDPCLCPVVAVVVEASDVAKEATKARGIGPGPGRCRGGDESPGQYEKRGKEMCFHGGGSPEGGKPSGLFFVSERPFS